MEKKKADSILVLATLLLIAATVMTAISQDSPKLDLEAMAVKGEAIANQDPLAIELRNNEPEGPARRGFDIGMAAAEGQTLPGPGKQKLRYLFAGPEQNGYDVAVSFSLERNRNARFASIGASIANTDAAVATARNAEPAGYRYRSGVSLVFYRLGFDIATGIFGDPALGAQGNTASGPGSLKIRDSLSPPAQSGFNYSMAFELGRRGSAPAPSPRRRTPKAATSINSPIQTADLSAVEVN
jgi:hypothetical protein